MFLFSSWRSAVVLGVFPLAVLWSLWLPPLCPLAPSSIVAAHENNESDPAQDSAETKISFKNDVMPILMRGGCNGGACHGSARGKDGFKLSLFGYDPEGDYYRLLEEQFGRRINLASPKNSLLLEKATGKVPHTGGKIFSETDEYYQTILRWIEQGAPTDPAKTRQPISLSLEPKKLTFDKSGQSFQAKVIAEYDDGSVRDVSNLALYLTNNESIATIDSNAKIQSVQPGGTHVFARFNRFTTGTEIVVLPSGNFEWPNPPQFNIVDQLVDEKLKELRIVPSELATDEQFLRRVTIDLIGKLPTPKEYQDFISSSEGNKRADKIDELLKRAEFGELWAAKWGEWLKIKTDTNPGSGTAMKAGWNYYHWLKESLVENRPWDEISYQLLTGNGSNFRNPPSNFYTMLPQGTLDANRLSEDTAQLFMGLRIQCAQCHNHPFDRWTINDYYSFSSFFTGVRRKHGTEAREYFTYIDIDAAPAKHLINGRPMPAQFLGADVANIKGKDPRKVLATWLTDEQNNLFRRNLTNRIWDHFFGRGIIHPVDDVRISNPASNEPLIEELSRRFAEDYHYDPKKLVREICNSRTYQSSAKTNKSNRRDDRWFSHSYLRRMRADVMFDCLNQAIDHTPKFRRSTANRATVMFEGGSRDNFNMYFFSTFGQAKRETVCTCETITEANLSQTLHLINGNTINNSLDRNPVLIPKLMKNYQTDSEIIRAIYIRALSRPPSDSELAAILALKPDSKETSRRHEFFKSIVWSILNSNEFMFNH